MKNKMRTTSLLGIPLALFLLCVPFIGSTTALESLTAGQLVQNKSWENLTPAQQQTLAPLASDWNSFTPARRQKWLAMADKFQKMNPDEKKHIQDKMQAWTKLTPTQRAAARENYLRSNTLQPEQRDQRWQEYQQLTEEKKVQLMQHREKKKLITTLPTPAESKVQPLQPLKKPHTRTEPTP